MIYKLQTMVSSSVILGIWTNIVFHLYRININNNDNKHDANDDNEIDKYIQNFGGYIR